MGLAVAVLGSMINRVFHIEDINLIAGHANLQGQKRQEPLHACTAGLHRGVLLLEVCVLQNQLLVIVIG